MDYWLESFETRLQVLEKVDRTLVHALVYGTLRWQGRLDFIINQMAKNPNRIDARVRIILRLALFQLLYLDRIPASAVVNTAVELAKQNKLAWSAGFINALLRKAAAGPLDIPWPERGKTPSLATAIHHSVPEWLVSRWQARWGQEETDRLCAAINTIPTVTLRTNTLRTNRPALLAAIQREARHIASTVFTPEGIILSGLERPFAQWPSFQNGWFQVQDEAAQLVAHCLSPPPGALVWDACAGLGTKSAHLAQLMGNKGTIVATDLSASKLVRLDAEMKRLGISIVSSRCLDLLTSTAPSDLPLFEYILVDAPCSGLGVLQKNPDGKWRTSPNEPSRCQQRQIRLLERAAHFLQPGGKMVYAVCSVEPEENEGVIKAFLQKHPGFAINPLRLAAVVQPDRLMSPQGWLTTLPHQHGMDGFFAAALVKQ